MFHLLQYERVKEISLKENDTEMKGWIIMKEVKLRPIANEICELFEDILDKHGITIPDEDDDQKEEGNCARLYGMTYATLEDEVVSILCKFASEIDPNCNVELLDEY